VAVTFKYSGISIKNGDQVIKFGKHNGKMTFSDLYEKDPSYCKWFIKASEEPTDFLPVVRLNP
jgi:hypothetical protein